MAADMKEVGRAVLAEQLAFDFRGCVSFWIAGELQDGDLGTAFRAGACALLLGFANSKRRAYLIGQIKSLQSASVGRVAPTSLA